MCAIELEDASLPHTRCCRCTGRAREYSCAPAPWRRPEWSCRSRRARRVHRCTSNSRLTRSPSSGGIGPVSWLWASCSDFRRARLPRSADHGAGALWIRAARRFRARERHRRAGAVPSERDAHASGLGAHGPILSSSSASCLSPVRAMRPSMSKARRSSPLERSTSTGWLA